MRAWFTYNINFVFRHCEQFGLTLLTKEITSINFSSFLKDILHSIYCDYFIIIILLKQIIIVEKVFFMYKSCLFYFSPSERKSYSASLSYLTTLYFCVEY